MNIDSNWQGTGWYAPILHKSFDHEWTEYIKVGDDPTQEPNLFGTGYGTPTWIDDGDDADCYDPDPEYDPTSTLAILMFRF